jgi:hypothetical protein
MGLNRRRAMKTFNAKFFKNLTSSDGHAYKCLQNSIEVTGEDAGDALLSAKREFEHLTHAADWRHRADVVELEETA